MAIYRPAVLQYVDPLDTTEVGFPFKDGIVVDSDGPRAITVGPLGAYVPSNWPYRSLGTDPNTGVAVATVTYA